MPNEFPWQEYYFIVRDHSIPKELEDNENIILTPKGMQELAEYYKEKYNVDITVIPFSTHLKYGAKALCKYLEQKKLETGNQEFYRCGIVLFHRTLGRYGHAMPIIWEKNGQVENLFLLDAGQELGDISDDAYEAKQFRDKIQDHFPQLTIWSHRGKRQVDLSSCTTDAMVILKDGLRLHTSLAEETTQKFIHRQQKIKFFHMPEHLLKTAQISSFAGEKSCADIKKEIHTHREKDESGIKTGQVKSITLEEFRKKYEIPVSVEGKIKKFGTYTIEKGKKIAEILQARWEKKQQLEEMPEIENQLSLKH